MAPRLLDAMISILAILSVQAQWGVFTYGCPIHSYTVGNERIDGLYPEPYTLVQREPNGYYEISEDPQSPKFHPTIIMSMCTGVGFPPFTMAGMSDMVTFLRDGHRSTHLDKNNQIFGFNANVAHHVHDLIPHMCITHPDIAAYAKEQAEALGKNDAEGWKTMDDIQFAKDVEDKFGTHIVIKRTDYHTPKDAMDVFIG